MNSVTSAHFERQPTLPLDTVRIDDLKRLLELRKPLNHWTIWVAFTAIMALQIAGPEGFFGAIALPGPAWVYPVLAILCLGVAISVRLGVERDMLAMEMNRLKLRGLRDAAAHKAMLDRS